MGVDEGFTPFDPEAPWLDESLSWPFGKFTSDEACREFMARVIRGAAGRGTFSEEALARLTGICWNAARNPDGEFFRDHLQTLIRLAGVQDPEDPDLHIPLQLHRELHTTWPDSSLPAPTGGPPALAGRSDV